MQQTRSFRAKHEALYASDRDCVRYDEALCQQQDHANALVQAIRDVIPLLPHTHLADVGAGTGKLARRLAEHVGTIDIVDRSAEALSVARTSFADRAVRLHQTDLRALPLQSGSVHLVVAGWAVSYLKSENEVWHEDGSSSGPWRDEVDAALREMDRVLAPGGTMIILETLGTATVTEQRSGSWLYAHYRASGMQQRTVRTDYRFADKKTALATLLFFFGKGVARRAQELLANVADTGEACIVPECTGMWWRHKAEGPSMECSRGQSEAIDKTSWFASMTTGAAQSGSSTGRRSWWATSSTSWLAPHGAAAGVSVALLACVAAGACLYALKRRET